MSSTAEQIRDYLAHLIQNKPLIAGDPLPSERELAVAFSTNRETAHLGFTMLRARGVIHTGLKGRWIVSDEVPPENIETLRQIRDAAIELIDAIDAMNHTPGTMLTGQEERATQDAEDALRHLVGRGVSTEPELQHQTFCHYAIDECTCTRRHLIDEAGRLRELILKAQERQETT